MTAQFPVETRIPSKERPWDSSGGAGAALGRGSPAWGQPWLRALPRPPSFSQGHTWARSCKRDGLGARTQTHPRGSLSGEEFLPSLQLVTPQGWLEGRFCCSNSVSRATPGRVQGKLFEQKAGDPHPAAGTFLLGRSSRDSGSRDTGPWARDTDQKPGKELLLLLLFHYALC